MVMGGLFKMLCKHTCIAVLVTYTVCILYTSGAQDVIQYCALSFTRMLSDKYEWVLAVSRNLKTMKQVHG